LEGHSAYAKVNDYPSTYPSFVNMLMHYKP
jgi:hypothetical protein